MLKKMKVMTNSKNGFKNRLTVGESELESISHFKYLGAISCEAMLKARDFNKNSTSSCSNVMPKISMEGQKNQ